MSNFLQDDVILRDLLIKQITHLNIDIKCQISLVKMTVLKVFELIISLCKNLMAFNFGDMLFSRKRVIPLNILQSRSYTCSTLVKLIINIQNFFDLAHILDGRFNCLSTLIVSVSDHYGPTNIDRIVSNFSVYILSNTYNFLFLSRNKFRH